MFAKLFGQYFYCIVYNVSINVLYLFVCITYSVYVFAN